MSDWLYFALVSLLLAQWVGWLFTFKRLYVLLEDLSSTEMEIATLVRAL